MQQARLAIERKAGAAIDGSAEDTGGVLARNRELFGHPRGAFALAGTELWERFAFFGTMGLLVHFLTASTRAGGFGWHASDAITLVGTFFAATWGLPVLGSWLADRWLGARRSITLGAFSLMLGYFVLAMSRNAPGLIETLSGVAVSSVLQSADVPLGVLRPPPDVIAALTAGAGSESARAAIMTAFALTGWTFYGGLFLIVAGNMFFKPCIVASVGLFYTRDDKRREGGYTILYLCINLGGLLSNFIIGTLGERVGWQYGFAVAGLGMAIGLAVFLLNSKRYFQRNLDRPRFAGAGRQVSRAGRLSAAHPVVTLITLIMVFTALYIAAYGQLLGSVNDFVFHKIDRTWLGFEIPATWFLSLNPLFIMIFGTVFAAVWQRLEEHNANPPVLAKYCLGMTLICLSFMCLVGAAVSAGNDAGGKGHMLWVVAAYLLFTLGELLIFPIFMALITRLPPRRYTNLGAGLFFLAAGIGGFASGHIGSLMGEYREASVFAGIGAGALLAGFAALALARRFRIWTARVDAT